jgi:hypothetical protein
MRRLLRYRWRLLLICCVVGAAAFAISGWYVWPDLAIEYMRERYQEIQLGTKSADVQAVMGSPATYQDKTVLAHLRAQGRGEFRLREGAGYDEDSEDWMDSPVVVRVQRDDRVIYKSIVEVWMNSTVVVRVQRDPVDDRVIYKSIVAYTPHWKTTIRDAFRWLSSFVR